jgi:hypothetical protein
MRILLVDYARPFPYGYKFVEYLTLIFLSRINSVGLREEKYLALSKTKISGIPNMVMMCDSRNEIT